jgi:hypothetical protein
MANDTTDLARRIRLDVSNDNITFLQVFGITDLNFPITPTKAESTAYDTNGWKDYAVTLQEWTGSIKVNRRSNAGVQNPSQVMLTNCVGQFDPNNSLYLRWYDNTGKAEPSWTGYALVEQAQSKTGVADLDEDSFTFTGRGAATKIANPYAATAVPVITSATPSGVAVGNLVQIQGQGFTGATLVKFGAVAATVYQVASDSLIYAVMPAGSAGAAAVTVTNPTGISAAFTYVRGA